MVNYICILMYVGRSSEMNFRSTTLFLMVIIISSMSGCIVAKNKLAEKSKKSIALTNVNISSVQIQNNQLIVQGSGLENVKTIKLLNNGVTQSLAVESVSSGQLVANGVSAITIGVGNVFDMVLATASASATFPVSFTLQNGSVTSVHLNNMGASAGQVLKFNGANWVPTSQIDAQTYIGTWDATTTIPDVTMTNSGDYYIVSTAGGSYSIGDWIISDGYKWTKVAYSKTAVASFNGRKGIVTLIPGDYVSLKSTMTPYKITGSKLSDFADIDVTGILDGQVLKWNAGTSKWLPANAASGGAGIALTDISASSPLSYNSTTGVFSLPTANVLALPLTGLASGSGTIAATDSILAAFGKLMSVPNDYVSKASANTMTGATVISGIGASLTVPTPFITDYSYAANVQFVTDQIAANGNWSKGASSSINYIDGNVGIGTTAPSSKLHLKGGLKIEDPTDTTSRDFIFNVSSGGVFSIADSETGDILSGNGVAPLLISLGVQVDSGKSIAAGGGSIQFGIPASDNEVLVLRQSGTPRGVYVSAAGSALPSTYALESRFGVDMKAVFASDVLVSGNVGIGTTAPGHRLVVQGDVASGAALQSRLLNTGTGDAAVSIMATSGDPKIWFGNSGSMTSGWQMGIDHADSDKMKISYSPGDVQPITTTPRMTIDQSGNVGIGTTTPSTKLDVAGEVRTGNLNVASGNTTSIQIDGNRDDAGEIFGELKFYNDDSGETDGIFATNGTGLQLFVDSSVKMTLNSSGNVGIGTTSPRALMDVNGVFITKAAVSNATSTINFSTANFQYTTADCGAFNLHSMKDGGTYTFVVKGTTSATCSFNAFSDAGSTALTFHLPPDHAATTNGKHTIYTFIVVGDDVYASWLPGA